MKTNGTAKSDSRKLIANYSGNSDSTKTKTNDTANSDSTKRMSNDGAPSNSFHTELEILRLYTKKAHERSSLSKQGRAVI